MPKQVVRLYKLEKKDKEIIQAYLHSEITCREAAASFGMTTHNFKCKVASIFRQLVSDGTLDITSELSSY